MPDDILTPLEASTLLPAGYTQRAATWEDIEALAHMYTTAAAYRGQPRTVTAHHLLSEWQSPHIDFLGASQVFFNPQGEMVACVAVWDKFNPMHPQLEWELVPDDHWQVVLRALVFWGEQRASQALARCQPEERFAPYLTCDATQTEVQSLFEAAGYEPMRYFYLMDLKMQSAPTVMPMPEGLILKTFSYPADLEAAILAKDEIWQDHYEYVPRALPDIITSWTHIIESDAKFDASLWFLAVDVATGTIAGLVLTRLEDRTNPDQGSIEIVGVRRDYRKRGLAQAMLTHAFAKLWARGQKNVGLDVDASSPTGAARLYERVGMRVVQRFVRLEKELRPGVERVNTGE